MPFGYYATTEDLFPLPQYQARSFWVEIEHPELGTKIPYPREFVKSSEADCSTRFRAPSIGEHNEAVYKEIGLSQEDLDTIKQAGII